jgi:hypothetical protein
MVFLATSTLKNCGKPISEGSARSQVSPGSHECASKVAQRSGVLPSKSAAEPNAGNSVQATVHTITFSALFTSSPPVARKRCNIG